MAILWRLATVKFGGSAAEGLPHPARFCHAASGILRAVFLLVLVTNPTPFFSGVFMTDLNACCRSPTKPARDDQFEKPLAGLPLRSGHRRPAEGRGQRKASPMLARRPRIEAKESRWFGIPKDSASRPRSFWIETPNLPQLARNGSCLELRPAGARRSTARGWPMILDASGDPRILPMRRRWIWWGAVQRVAFEISPFEPQAESRTGPPGDLAHGPAVGGGPPVAVSRKGSRLKRGSSNRWQNREPDHPRACQATAIDPPTLSHLKCGWAEPYGSRRSD